MLSNLFLSPFFCVLPNVYSRLVTTITIMTVFFVCNISQISVKCPVKAKSLTSLSDKMI